MTSYRSHLFRTKLPRPRALFAALAMAGLSTTAAAQSDADADADALAKEIRALNARVQKLEADASRADEMENRVHELEAANAKLAAKVAAAPPEDPSHRSFGERLSALETTTLSMQEHARKVEYLEEITLGGSITTVAQRTGGDASLVGDGSSELSWRGDLEVSLPAGSMGSTKGDVFFHLRAGQGEGVAMADPTMPPPNATVFQQGDMAADNSSAIIAQAWYQLTTPLGDAGTPQAKHLHVNFGKMDPFLFFDQNNAADDETSQFLNLAFVHNPLLDAGGGAGLDSYGFTPGLRLAYFDEPNEEQGWAASLGVFGSGPGASFTDALTQPFTIGQLETWGNYFGIGKGHYRAYVWHNGRATPYNNPLDDATEAQSGFGFSLDQQLTENVSLWARYGQSISGKVQYDYATTLGAQISGKPWGREDDAVGLAVGLLDIASDFEEQGPGLDANGDGVPDFSWDASGDARIFEAYYRWQINSNFAITPDYQYFRHTGDRGGSAWVVGLRALVTF